MAQVPLMFTTTQMYVIWVDADDWDGIPVERLAKRIEESGDSYEYLSRVSAIDGWIDVEPIADYQWHSVYSGEPAGPQDQCHHQDCTALLYPGYHQRYCFRHTPKPTQ